MRRCPWGWGKNTRELTQTHMCPHKGPKMCSEFLAEFLAGDIFIKKISILDTHSKWDSITVPPTQRNFLYAHTHTHTRLWPSSIGINENSVTTGCSNYLPLDTTADPAHSCTRSHALGPPQKQNPGGLEPRLSVGVWTSTFDVINVPF